MYRDEIQENRLRNFRRIISSVNGTNEAARMMNKKNTYITQIAGPTPTRNIGNKIAAQIENTFGLAPGSLDLPPPPEALSEDALIAELSSVMVNTSTEDKKMMIGIAKLFAERNLKTIKPSDL